MNNTANSILKEIQRHGKCSTAELVETTGLTRQAVHRCLTRLIQMNMIRRLGSGRRGTVYIPSGAPVQKEDGCVWVRTFDISTASEDRVLSEVERDAPWLATLTPDARKIFRYAFTEMVNNAIDHSRGKVLRVEVGLASGALCFTVDDTGIGVFANIREKMGLPGELDAIQELLKGKQTTMPDRHSGEGIFFTSKAADRFELTSHNKRLIVDNAIEDVFLEDSRFKKGTRVRFEIHARTKRSLEEIFRAYTSTEYAFDKSKVAVKIFQVGETPVSRSEARRLLFSIEKFKEVVLDFTGVESVGQAFADEIFRVFHTAHPDILLTPTNMNENVAFMVRRAKEASRA